MVMAYRAAIPTHRQALDVGSVRGSRDFVAWFAWPWNELPVKFQLPHQAGHTPSTLAEQTYTEARWMISPVPTGGPPTLLR
jgi:hypothetical protein